jgi:signal transduction histidine kinase
MFLDQLIVTLEMEQKPELMRSSRVSCPSGGGTSARSEIATTAAQHGRELMERGFTIEQVVHDYGDLCQAITELAFALGVRIEIDEFRTLNRCLDDAIADAVTEFNYRRDVEVADKGARAWNTRLGILSHELRSHLNTATLALYAIKAGDVGLKGATGALLDSSLAEMEKVINRSLSEVRLAAGLGSVHHLFSLADFIDEVKVSASLQAHLKKCSLTVPAVDRHLAVRADRDLLLSAVSNLLKNAFEFTRPSTEVTLTAYGTADRILIEVKDNCGGLPPGIEERIFDPFVQGSEGKSGFGLGLSIARQSVVANGGMLSIRDIPGAGCVFTVDLHREKILQPSTLSGSPG